jgi:hypothetical protein
MVACSAARTSLHLVAALTILFGAGCLPPGLADGGQDLADAATDGGSLDAGPLDAGPLDAGPSDAGLPDAGPIYGQCVASHVGQPLASPADGGYALYACRSDRAWPVLARVTGPRMQNAESDVKDLRKVLTDDQLLAIPGVIGIETTLCCGKLPVPPVCLGLYFQSHTTPSAAILDLVSGRIRDAGFGCIGVNLEMIGIEAPRCSPGDDAGCGPVPMCPALLPGGACCQTLAPYMEGSTRTPLPNAEYNIGSCGNDGDCFRNGAGNHCTSWTTPGFIAASVCAPALSTAHCGCVQNKCTWFTQP